MSRGTLDQFEQIVVELAKNIKSYEDKRIKHYAFAEMNDSIFSAYNWSKSEFFKEVNIRLGNKTNESREEDKKQRIEQSKLKARR